MRPYRRMLLCVVMLMTHACPSTAQTPEKPGSERSTGDGKQLPQVESRELSLSVGENTTIPAVGVKSFSEGDEGIVQVRITPDGKNFVVVGKRTGRSSLLLLKQDGTQLLYKIEVFRLDMSTALAEIEQLLGDTPGIRVRRVGGRLFIEGGVSSEAELGRVQKVASLYPGQVESLVVLGGAAADRRQNVKLDIYFVEFDRSKAYRVGVDYPGRLATGTASLSYDFVKRGYTQATAEVSGQTLPGLDFAAERGWAKVLKHSTLITANGSEATFSSGGEQNFRVSGGLSSTIQSVRFGTNVKVLPRFDSATHEMEIKVTTDVSDLTATGASEIPGRLTSELSTLVSLKLGQGLVLSGIRSSSRQHGVRGLPLLSDIPVLGILFGSHSDSEQELEEAIYLVPSIIEAIPLENRRVLEELLRRYEEYSGDIEPRYEPLTTKRATPPPQERVNQPKEGRQP